MISIECSECSKTYKVKPEMAGKKAKCKCGASIQIPRPKAKQTSKPAPQRKKRKPQPEADPWDVDVDAYDDEGGFGDEDDFGYDDGYDDSPPPARRGSGSAGGGSKRSGGRSKKGKKKGRSGETSSVVKIVGLVFGGVALLGLLVGLLVKPVGAITAMGLVVVCAALCIGGSLRCLIAAFQEDIICGVMWLFVPFYSLYYIISRFSELSQYILMWVGGLVGMFVCIGYMQLLTAMS